MKTRFFAGILVFSAFTGLLTGCGKATAENASTAENVAPAETVAPAENNSPDSQNSAENQNTPDLSTSGNTFVITLYPDQAPITCENFEKLVNDGFYNGVGFHRVVEGFMAQGGDPLGTGTGGSGTNIKGEFEANGVHNTLSHKRGVVSMARSQMYDSASSQFFICYDDSCTFLDGQYAAFGEVTEGMEVVDDFLKVERSYNSGGELAIPNTPITMESVTMIEADENGNPRVQVTMNDFLNSSAE